MKAKLIRLSVCPCGFPLLKESIALGTEYEVHPDNFISSTLICGGCKSPHPLVSIYVEKRGESRGGYLPLVVFDIPKPPL